MPATLSTVDAILKDDYKEYLDNLNNANFILSQVETRKDTVQGRIARHAVHLGRSSGVGARAENGTLPTAGNRGFRNSPGSRTLRLRTHPTFRPNHQAGCHRPWCFH